MHALTWEQVPRASRSRLPLLASCEARGVVDPPVAVTAARKTRFPSAACTSHGVRRERFAAPLRAATGLAAKIGW